MQGHVRAEINVTPLVDVCLVLLIIFMVVTPLIDSQVELPEAPAPVPWAPEPARSRVILSYGPPLAVRVDDDPDPLDDAGLAVLLAAIHREDPRREIARCPPTADRGPPPRTIMPGMRVLFLAAEASPLVKVGGLADVVGSLPGALRARPRRARGAPRATARSTGPVTRRSGGRAFPVPHDVGSPRRRRSGRRPSATSPHWLVTGPPIPRERWIYGRSIDEDGPKFIFFSLAALWASETLDWKPDVVHAHDCARRAGGLVARARRAATIPSSAPSPPSSRSTTSRYAAQGAGKYPRRIQACAVSRCRWTSPPPGLPRLAAGPRDSLGRLALDRQPDVCAGDPHARRRPRSRRRAAGPRRPARRDSQRHRHGVLEPGDRSGPDRRALRRRDALPPDAPTRRRSSRRPASARSDADAASRGRLAPRHAEGLRRRGAGGPPVARGGGQFVLLGTGDPALEQEYGALELRYPHRASVRLRFDARYARRIYGGADAIVLPSRYEPCGLDPDDRHALRMRAHRAPDGRPRRHGRGRRRSGRPRG